MAEHHGGDGSALAKLATPTRNRYFYGKLLDTFHFEMEQNYFNRKRWLLNRLTLGSGVICGLSVAPTNDGKLLRIGPGAAIDPIGRETVVPDPSRPFDPREITDACGRIVRRVEGAGPVTLYLAYHECEADPVPVLVGDCETERGCAPSIVRERYMVLVREGAPPPIAPACQLPGLFTPSEGKKGVPNIHPRLVERVSKACPEVEGDNCVVLARVNLPPAGEAITADMIDHSVRPVVIGNTLLFELLLCLAERVEECCAQAPETLPVVRAIWPPNAVRLSSSGADTEVQTWYQVWVQQPRLEITFDREMAAARLADPKPWLRLWGVRSTEANEVLARGITLRYEGRSDAPVLGQAAFTAVYRLDAAVNEFMGARYIVQIRATADAIVDTATPPRLLDADFAGTNLNKQLLDDVWKITRERRVPQEVWAGLVDTGAVLPSGDRTAGGFFHSWFEVSIDGE